MTGGALRVVCQTGDKRVQSQVGLQSPCGDGAADLQLGAGHDSVGEHELDRAWWVGVNDALALHGRHRHLQEAGGIGLNIRCIWRSKSGKNAEGLIVCDIVFYEASAFRWTYTTHSEGQDLICRVLQRYRRCSTVHFGVWRHSAAQILVLCAVGFRCHRTTRSCSQGGEHRRSRSSARLCLPSPSAGTRPPRSPEHLHPARKCTSIYLPFLKAQRLVNPFHYFLFKYT